MKEETKKLNLNENETKVLTYLREESMPDGEYCLPFDWISDGTTLDRKAVRRACRSLARKGLAGFYRGLMDDDGKVAGSGYSITFAGEDFVDKDSEGQ